MIGAIIGDIVGSRFEWDNHRSKDFDFLTHQCFFTDDSVMSLAVCDALMHCKPDYSDLSNITIESMQRIGRPYPHCGYGGSFYRWMYSDNPQPYNSYGNGAAMRVGGCGYVANSVAEAAALSRAVTETTHNHPEGIKGAEATAIAVYLARTGSSLMEIQDYIVKNYYPINFTLDSIRDTYQFNETCQDTVPQALEAFFESTSFEDAIRNAISIGGDSDTLAAITGAVAEAYYGVPTNIRKHALTFLDERLLKILLEFENKYPAKFEKIQESGSVGVKPSTGKKVKTGGRAEMMQSAMDIADMELEASAAHPEETTSQKLFSHLFEACNILRGPINQDEYKSYVTPILFFKRLSDVYDEETQVALEESGGDEEYASFPENHRFVIPEGCHWKDVREASENVGVAIVTAMNGIERANPDTLSGVFSSFDDANWTDKTKLSDERLKDLIEHKKKSEFNESLDELIKKSVAISGNYAELSYEKSLDYKRISTLLLLFNIESVRRSDGHAQRFPFDQFKHHKGSNVTWSLEHIHAQQSEGMKTQDVWKKWLELHIPSVESIGGEHSELIDEMQGAINADKLERTVFESIQQKVLGLLSVSGNTEYMHSIANLALLNTADNAALNNSTFDVKRNDIIQMDKKGQYIPFCTKMVFLKYYTPSAENQLHFWGQADRIAYIKAINDVLSDYIEPIVLEKEETK